MKHKILTLDDLTLFCKENNFLNFSSKESGYQLVVQVPAEFAQEEIIDDTLMFGKVKLFHTGLNRNNSSVTYEAAKKCLSTIKYKPLLANFCEVDGVKDFTAHDIEINEDGSITYIERQIGCFTAEDPEMQYDEENDRYYVYANVAIPKEYTDAAEIIERKNGTKISVELLVNEMQYDAKEKILELTDIIVLGATCLGKDTKTGVNVEEGMEGARLDILDFSIDNNSVTVNALIDLQDKVNKLMSCYFNKNNIQEGGSDSGMENNKKNANSEEDLTVSFSISHDDIRSSLYRLIAEYLNLDDYSFYIVEVFDNYCVMSSFPSLEYYAYKYIIDNDIVSLDGEPYEVFPEFLTKEEKDALDEMRTNYPVLVSYKEENEKQKLLAEKQAILNNERFARIAQTEEFKNLIENIDNYSVEEIEKEAKVIDSDFNFSNKNKKINFAKNPKAVKSKAYGTLFN